MTRLFFALLLSAVTAAGHYVCASPRWSEQKAKEWAEASPWFCGFNYIPANAINYTAMWDKTGFSPDVIDRELALAEEIGLNCSRVVLQYAVYEDNPRYFLRTFDRFLAICEKHGIKVMPTFFDDCVFGVNTDPATGLQPEPLDGWYAWAWSPSPGHTMVIDTRTHSRLEKYGNVKLLQPLDYPYLVYLMKNAKLILTDSGGIQEEAPSFGCPTLVMRYETERQEGIDAGVSILVGADYDKIISSSEAILAKSKEETRLKAQNPYGDGTSAKKIVEIMNRELAL